MQGGELAASGAGVRRQSDEQEILLREAAVLLGAEAAVDVRHCRSMVGATHTEIRGVGPVRRIRMVMFGMRTIIR